MPIYATLFELRLAKRRDAEMSDAPLTICPECGKETLAKQLTAAGFQLKGNGYYATDFKDKPKPSAHPARARALARWQADQ